MPIEVRVWRIDQGLKMIDVKPQSTEKMKAAAD